MTECPACGKPIPDAVILSAAARLNGQQSTTAKAAAARANGRKGGRPAAPRTVVRIHEAPTGKWHLSDDALPHLDERGPGYGSAREAIAAARGSRQWTHRVGPNGRLIRL